MKKINQLKIASNASPNQFSFVTFIFFSLIILFLTASACSTIRLQLSQFSGDKRSELPRDIKSAEEDTDLVKESSCIVSVSDDSGTYFMGKDQVAEAQLTGKIVEKLKDKSPYDRIVYIESAITVKYQTVVKLLNLIRKANVDKAGLVVFKTNNERAGTLPNRIEVRLHSEPNEQIDDKPLNPNPLTLLVFADGTGNLLLNNEKYGNLGETASLMNKLTDVFKERERNGVFRQGSNEVEKTTFIKASKGLKYGDVVRVIDAVKLAGANPIGLQLDHLDDSTN